MKPYTIVVMRKKELFIAILSAKSPHDAAERAVRETMEMDRAEGERVRRSMYRVLIVFHGQHHEYTFGFQLPKSTEKCIKQQK